MTIVSLFYAALNLSPELRREDARDIAEAIHDAGALADVDDGLLLALAFHESRFDRNLVDPDHGAAGLFQLHGPHLFGIHPRHVADPAWSARTAARLLRDAITRTGSIAGGLRNYSGALDRPVGWAEHVLDTAHIIRGLTERGP